MNKILLVSILLLIFIGSVNAGLTDNLIAYYKLDETSGTTLVDSHINNYNGEIQIAGNTILYAINQEGLIGRGHRLANGHDSGVSVLPTYFNTNYYSKVKTVSLWVKPTGYSGIIYSATPQGACDLGLQVWFNSNNTYYYTIKGTGGTKTLNGSKALSTSNWSHLVFIQDGTNMILYENGTFINSTALPSGLYNTLNGTYLGNYYCGHSGSAAFMDEVAIYDRVLSTNEITGLYNSGSGLTYPFDVNAVFADFDYVVTGTQVDLNDTSSVSGDAVIDSWEWLIDDLSVSTDQNYSFTGVEATDYNVCLIIQDTVLSLEDSTCQTISISDLTPPITSFESNQITGSTDQNIVLTCDDGTGYGCKTINFRINNGDWNYYTIGDNPLTIIYSGAGDHNIQFYSTDNADNNEATKTSTFSTSGLLRLNFFDDTTKTSLNQVYLEFNGTPYYSDSNNFIYIDLNGLTSGSKTILLQRTGYQEKSFSLNLNQYSDINYNIGFIESTNISEVDFQVFTETGALKPNTSFTATDNDNNYLIDIKTTDSQGRVTFYLNNQKSDYNFVSTDLNFGTTLWTINKPKDASTLVDIVGNWKYSITGNSYSSGTNIVANVQKILLQNTVNPYYIKIQDVNENYAESSFGLKSITSEKTKTLNPFIYPFGSAELKLIKLLDFSTNQPISTFNELLLSLYTDSNGLIEIGTYINDSTGTYNIYMDSNAQYKLVIDEQTFILKPTLSVYYLYLTTPSGLHIDTNTPLVDNNWVDLNSPTIILEVRQFFFGCPIEEDNCYPSMVFALIAIVILSIGLVGLMRLGPLEQSVINIILLSVFTFIGFIPLWLFGITLVIILAWGVFA